MVLRSGRHILPILLVLCVSGLVLGNEFKFEYNYTSPNSIKLRVDYDRFRIDWIKYGHIREYQPIQKYERYSDGFINIPDLVPCTLYEFSVIILFKNKYEIYNESILMISSDLVLQIEPHENTIQVSMNHAYEACFPSLVVLIDLSRVILYPHANLSTWSEIKNLSPCTNYNLEIYITINSVYHKIIDKTLTTKSMQFREVESINYDNATTTLRWPNFLKVCPMKYLIVITSENNRTGNEQIILKSVMNEYKLDFLDGCSTYNITVTSENDRDLSINTSIEQGFKDPGPITNLKAELVNNTLLINWSRPIKNPACIDHYNVQIDKIQFDTKAHEHTLLDYNSSIIYNITVCQVPLGLEMCINYTFFPSKYEVIQNISFIDVNTNSLNNLTTIVWNVSDYEKHHVKYYEARLFYESLQLMYQKSDSAMINFPKLVPCKTYRLEIETFPIQKWQSKIKSSFELTTKPKMPDMPLSPKLISSTLNSLTMQTKYVNSIDKCKIEMFQIVCEDDGQIKRSAYDEEGHVTINNLKSNTGYRCTAFAKNVLGWSNSSETNHFAIKRLLPYKFVEMYVNSISSNFIEVSWVTQLSGKWFLNITKTGSNDQIPKRCDSLKYTFETTVDSNFPYKFVNLEPNTNYSIRLDGADKQNENYATEIFVTTDPDVPFQVIHLNISHLTSRSVTIIWQLPCKLNGRIKSFVGQVVEFGLTESVHDWTVPYYNAVDEIFNYTVNHIKPEHNYSISVSIKLANFVAHLNESKIRFLSLADVPQLDHLSDIIVIDNPINEKVLKENKPGRFKLQCKPDVASTLLSRSNLCTWKCQCLDENTVEIILINETAPECRSTNHNSIKLNIGTEYKVGAKSLIFSGFTETPPTRLISNNIRLVFIIILVILILCLALILILATIRWYYKLKKTQSLPPNSTYIEVGYFSDFYKFLSKNFYAGEYQSINGMDLSGLDQTISKNQPGKNRYTDITPYDYNRVVLTPNEFCCTDYINASYIDGCRHKRQYIATQGPTEGTVYDFWHMVVEQKCNKIVMLTQLREDGITKCFKYFPHEDETLNFNDLEIANVDEMNFGNFIRRGLVISKGETKRLIAHYQFIVWPDRDCPANKSDLIEFVEFTRDVDNKSRNPAIVHCSAGVGRTGTFIALDLLLQSFQRDKYISIFETVRKLRKQRCRMVQNVDQYEFLYASVNMYYFKRAYKGKHVND